MSGDYKCDFELGKQVRKHLTELGIEPLKEDYEVPLRHRAEEVMKDSISEFLSLMGLDIEHPSLKKTPDRVGEMLAYELCAGLNYENFPKCTATPNDEKTDEMVMVDSIQTISLCEHHFQTIAGVTHIAYIPKSKVLGVSKFARVTRFFARRPQVQERMTAQIFESLKFVLATDDIAVSQRCAHFCMRARGVMDPHSMMTTNKLGGRFMSNPALRQEFLNAIPR